MRVILGIMERIVKSLGGKICSPKHAALYTIRWTKDMESGYELFHWDLHCLLYDDIVKCQQAEIYYLSYITLIYSAIYKRYHIDETFDLDKSIFLICK